MYSSVIKKLKARRIESGMDRPKMKRIYSAISHKMKYGFRQEKLEISNQKFNNRNFNRAYT